MVRSILVPFIALTLAACSETAQPPQPPQPPGGEPTNPCAAVLCAPNTICVAQPDGTARCIAQGAPAPTGNPGASGPCMKTGCSGTVCSDQQVMTTCEYREQYACYQSAICERDPASGTCGWRRTPELQACLQAHP
jgi:eight-cysteine-cluster-containing protein